MNEEFDIRRESLKTDQDFERALRPVRFEDFVGQDKIIENLRVFVAAAKLRGESLDHVLFHGPPGLGKTTLSTIIYQGTPRNMLTCPASVTASYL